MAHDEGRCTWDLDRPMVVMNPELSADRSIAMDGGVDVWRCATVKTTLRSQGRTVAVESVWSDSFGETEQHDI